MPSTARKLWALDAPTMTMDAGGLLVRATGLTTIPASPPFLIEHERGLALFDTGADPDGAGDPGSVYPRELIDLFDFKYAEDQRVDRQIEKLGYTVGDVKWVILSHLHFDHAGGMKLFPHADFFVFRGEFSYAYWPDPSMRGFFRIEDLAPTRGFRWHELDEDTDILGDGSLTFLRMPGHTPGGGSLLVRLPNQNIILAGDAVHTQGGLEQELWAPYDLCGQTSLTTIRRLLAIKERNGATIWVSHDPQDWATFPHAPKFLD